MENIKCYEIYLNGKQYSLYFKDSEGNIKSYDLYLKQEQNTTAS